MCHVCNAKRRWVSKCLDGRGPTPSPPRAYNMPQYPTGLVTQQPAPQPYPAARPSSSTSHYPGSNFAQTPSRGSSGSASSNISVESARSSVYAIQNSGDILDLTRRISQDTGNLQGTITQLDGWFAALNHAAYRKRNPWTDAMERAYDRYKDFAVKHGVAHKRFKEYIKATKENTTPEQHVERARLAIEWGQASVTGAESRLAFMEAYRNAYQLEGIQDHIDEARNQIRSARNAVYEARRNYESIWVTAGRQSRPEVFE